MLGTPQSPTGSVTPLGDSAALLMQPVVDGWYLFAVTSQHFYDPHDGLGANLSDAGAAGLVHLDGGKGTWRETNPYSSELCTLDFTRLARGGWAIGEAGVCGGIGASMAGTYRP